MPPINNKRPNKRRVKKIIKEIKPDWHRIISLSAAGHYIQTQLLEELERVKSTHNKG